jgi:TPR repeat protein|tara:strand:+ start:1900 stop:2598 length:699 start_codon:yes stop_codon:yes gene_type:complete
MYREAEANKVFGMKYALMVLILAMGLPWFGCSSITSEVPKVWGSSKSKVKIPSALFITTQGEAVKGDAAAQFKLGEWYRNGENVKLETAQAYAWFTISARNGHQQAKARVRAGWNPATIARGKDLAEILAERYPRARLDGTYENNRPNGKYTLTLLKGGKFEFELVSSSGENDFKEKGTWTSNNGEVMINGSGEKDIFLINTNGDLTMIATIRDGMLQDLSNLEGYRMKKIE